LLALPVRIEPGPKRTRPRRFWPGAPPLSEGSDDIVVGFEHEGDARRFWDAMRDRLKEFALTLHPEKTRLIEFGRHAAANRERRGLGKPQSFTFLGFKFICGKSRRGYFLLPTRPHASKAPGDKEGAAATDASANP
jgi:hypothetical protein